MKQREIKFRAWDNHDKKWLMGYEYPSLGGFSMFGECMLFQEWSGILNRFILQQKDRTSDDLILMQFTGLKDKNGVEIYEGDICKISDPYDENEKVFMVEYKNGGFAVEWDSMFCGGEADCTTIGWAIDSEFTIEVIGNIYENENLLKCQD